MWALILGACSAFLGTLVLSSPLIPAQRQKVDPTQNVTRDNPTFRSDQPNAVYDFTINQANACVGEVFLLVVVCSGAENMELRHAIRETWATSISMHSKLIFLLAQTHNSSIQENISRENRKYKDIIQADFIDSYKNLTLKSVAMLQWIQKYCSQTKYVLKSDDDIFINIPLLVRDLVNTIHSRFIMGQLIAGAKPDRNKLSKWFTPETLYAQTRYPEYISGCAYVISGDIIGDLLEATEKIALYWVEDVYITAMCAGEVGAKHVFNAKFGYRIRDSCMARNVITSHRQDPDKLRTLWTGLQAGTHC